MMTMTTTMAAGAAHAQPHYDYVLSRRQLASLLGVSVDTLKHLERAGDAPPRVQLSARRVGYRASAVEAWMRARTRA